MTLARISIDNVGSVVGVRYLGEDEVVVFVPGSAEVALCSAEEWQAAIKVETAEANADTGVLVTGMQPTMGQALQEFMSVLGASIR